MKTPPRFLYFYTVLTLWALCTAASAGADEAGLYDPAPPPGSAYLRLINAGSQGAIDLQLDQQRFVSAAATTASDYVVTPQGTKSAGWQGKTQAISLGAGKFYSLVISAGQAKLIEDPALQSRAKAMLRLYNLSTRPRLSLKTGDGKVAIIEDVPPMGAADRLVNNARLTLGVYDGTNRLAATSEVSVERGNAYSVLAVGSGESLRAIWVKSVTSLK